MNQSEQIAELLNKINKPASPLQKRAEICRVRAYGTFDNGDEAILLYNVEPITNPNYQDKTAWKETFKKDGSRDKLTQEMTDIELKDSMNNWIFNVTINADPDKSNENIQAGLFMLPKLDSFVVIEWFNDTDAYISLTSEISKIVITNDSGDTVEFKTSEFKVGMNEKDVQLLVSNLISLKNKNNLIEVKEDQILVDASNPNSEILLSTAYKTNIEALDGVVLRSKIGGNGEGTFEINQKFSMYNSKADLKNDIIIQLGLLIERLQLALVSIQNTFRISAYTDFGSLNGGLKILSSDLNRGLNPIGKDSFNTVKNNTLTSITNLFK